MVNKTVYVGADHGGRKLKNAVGKWLEGEGYEVVDLGAKQDLSEDDYPVFAAGVAAAVAANPGAKGLLACRSAAGIAIAANRLPGVRTAVVTDEEAARHAHEHNDANVLALSGDHLDTEEAKKVVQSWLEADASDEERHVRRRGELERIGTATAEVIPGVFEADPEVANQRVQRLRDAASIIHVDVADGRLVPATAFPNPDDADTLSPAGGLEVHLMVEQPGSYMNPWKASGATRVIGHVEAPGIADFVAQAPAAGVEVGVAIDLPTPLEKLQPLLGRAQFVVVMGVKAGKSSQPFGEEALLKIAKLRDANPDVVIEVDGGVNDRTAAALITAGADRLVSTSFVEQAEDPRHAIARLANPWKADG